MSIFFKPYGQMLVLLQLVNAKIRRTPYTITLEWFKLQDIQNKFKDRYLFFEWKHYC